MPKESSVDELFAFALKALPNAFGDLVKRGEPIDDFVYAVFDAGVLPGKNVTIAAMQSESGMTEAEAQRAYATSVAKAGETQPLTVCLTIRWRDLLELLKPAMLNASELEPVAEWFAQPVPTSHFRVFLFGARGQGGGRVVEVTKLGPTPAVLN